MSPAQVRRWEREGLIPPANYRVQRGSRLDRRYTPEQVAEIKQLVSLYHTGAPTMEEAEERAKRQARYLGREQ